MECPCESTEEPISQSPDRFPPDSGGRWCILARPGMWVSLVGRGFFCLRVYFRRCGRNCASRPEMSACMRLYTPACICGCLTCAAPPPLFGRAATAPPSYARCDTTVLSACGGCPPDRACGSHTVYRRTSKHTRPRFTVAPYLAAYGRNRHSAFPDYPG